MIEREDVTPSLSAQSVTTPTPALVPERVPSRMSVETVVLAVLVTLGLASVVVGLFVSPWWYLASAVCLGGMTYIAMDPGEPR